MKGHPFEPFPGTDAEMFIQWKGTDVCLDFYCPCGAHGHFDGDFAYNVRCPNCGSAFRDGRVGPFQDPHVHDEVIHRHHPETGRARRVARLRSLAVR